MKKIILLLIYFAPASNNVFCDSERWISIGGELGNHFEFSNNNGSDYSAYMMSPGAAINSYIFFDEFDLGIFAFAGILFPIKSAATMDGVTQENGLSIYDFIMQFSVLAGPIFRIHLSDMLKLYIGIGIGYINLFGNGSIEIQNIGNVPFTVDGRTLNVGANIGLKINIGEIFYMNAGSLVCYNLLGNISLQTEYGNINGALGGNGNDWKMIEISPYLCVGRTITRDYYIFPGF